jgi:drug/metabolite transporter (DMT)-like permease
VPLARLLPSLLLCAAGALCIGAQALGAGTPRPTGEQVIGLLCAIGALASWTAFTVGNARSLARWRQVSSHDWNLLMGLTAGAQSLVLLPFAFGTGTADHGAADWTRFAAVSMGVALLASIFGNLLWNRMSRLLPLTLAGQMILFETLFALVYGLLWEQRLPTLLEVAALSCVTLSVFTCLAAHRRPVEAEVHAH